MTDRGARSPAVDRVFYDGDCGLCHAAVRFAVARDRDGSRFRFAALAGETFALLLPEERRRELPDSIVLVRPDGRMLVRSDAIVHMLRRLGGGWGAAGAALVAIPRPIRDAGYDLVARIRKRLFAPPPAACPVLPPPLRDRFDP